MFIVIVASIIAVIALVMYFTRSKVTITDQPAVLDVQDIPVDISTPVKLIKSTRKKSSRNKRSQK
jgi:hypothetical protein